MKASQTVRTKRMMLTRLTMKLMKMWQMALLCLMDTSQTVRYDSFHHLLRDRGSAECPLIIFAISRGVSLDVPGEDNVLHHLVISSV